MATDDVIEDELDDEACWVLLAQAEVGRLAVASLNVPDVFPVNHVVADRTIVFRTGPGTKLDAALSAPAVAFEVDGHDREGGQAWSVVVKGVAHEVSSEGAEPLADALPLVSWHAGHKLRWIRITPHQVTGRQFRIAPPGYR